MRVSCCNYMGSCAIPVSKTLKSMKEQDKKGERFEDFQKEQNNNELFPQGSRRDGAKHVSNERDETTGEFDLNETEIENSISGNRQIEKDYNGISDDADYDGQDPDALHGFSDAKEGLESDIRNEERKIQRGDTDMPQEYEDDSDVNENIKGGKVK